jgi:hemerythrin-like domain-containing protein
MAIVHGALRRDLGRAKAVLAKPTPSNQQRLALSQHLQWMMRFLQQHHAGEDAGLFPMVRDRNAAAVDLLEGMDAEHRAIEPGMRALELAAADYGRSDGARQQQDLLAAIELLEVSLLPHLRREEEEMMPIVSATVTAAEWQAWDEAYNLKPKSLLELGREGHWLIDSLGPDDRRVVVGLVAPIPRFFLLHGFARSYRRHRSRCWG